MSNWKQANERRVELIHKDIFEGALSPSETSELASLNQRADKRIGRLMRGPLAKLEEIERQARQMEEAKNDTDG